MATEAATNNMRRKIDQSSTVQQMVRSGAALGFVRRAVVVMVVLLLLSPMPTTKNTKIWFCAAFSVAPGKDRHHHYYSAIGRRRSPRAMPVHQHLVTNQRPSATAQRRRMDDISSLSSLSSTALPAEKNPSGGSNSNSNSSTGEYTDDCFGLIFLSSSFVAHDTIFSVTFVVVSTVALLLTRANGIPPAWLTMSNSNVTLSRERQRRAVPAVVAIITLLLTPILTLGLTAVSLWETVPEDNHARFLELAVVGVSVLYGFLSPVEDDDE